MQSTLTALPHCYFLCRPPPKTKLSFPINRICTPFYSLILQLTNNNSSRACRISLFHQVYSFSGKKVRNQDQEPKTQVKKKGIRESRLFNFLKVIFTIMWLVDLKAALGQRINVEGIVSAVSVITKDHHLALPHVAVPDIRHIDWNELHKKGFRGVVFDKDNTITAPYSLALWPSIASSLEQCKAVFGSDVAVFSNSAGLMEYDHIGSKAKALEAAIGIKVVRHRVKKPAGTAEEIEKHFGCKSSQLVMVGDRPFTDIVYGNRNGFFTVLTEPLSLAGEPFIVKQVRRLELMLVNLWFKRGLKPIDHVLLPDALHCVKDPHSS